MRDLQPELQVEQGLLVQPAADVGGAVVQLARVDPGVGHMNPDFFKGTVIEGHVKKVSL